MEMRGVRVRRSFPVVYMHGDVRHYMGSKKEVAMLATDRRGIGQHIAILGWIYIVANTLLLMAGAAVFFLLFGVGYVSCAWEPFLIWTGLGLFLGVAIILVALLGILAGCGLLRCTAWGRTLAIIVAVLGLICFPVGTLIGIFALCVLLHDDAVDYCCRPKRTVA